MPGRLRSVSSETSLAQTKPLPPFSWLGGRIPNDLDSTASVRIRDTAPIFRLQQDQLVAEMATWAWLTPRGKPVFNFVSEERDFTHSDRVLILTTGFYEYTDPATPSVKLENKHLFSRPGEDWFWIAGIVKQGCFTMLTAAPGPDVAPYHDRQIVTLSAAAGLDWLKLSWPQHKLLQTPPARTFSVETIRQDGTLLAVTG